jgi:hypothetical protein
MLTKQGDVRQSHGGTSAELRRSQRTTALLISLKLERLTGDTTMADRAGLKFVGFIFASITLAVMLTTGMVVKGYADGAYSLDSAVEHTASIR